MTTLRLGTRRSALATTQSGHVADALRAAGHEVEGPVMDGRLFSAGLLLVATLAASFYATAKASDGLGRRDLTGEGVAATS